MKKLLIKSEFILIPFSPLIPAIPEKWTKDDLVVLTIPMTEVVPAIPEKWTKDDVVVFENPLDETFTHHPEVPEIPSVLDETFTYHPAIPEVAEVAEVKEWRVIDQTQGPEEELQVWLSGNIFKYPEGFVTEWIDLEQDFDYLLAKCHLLRASEYPSLGDQADAAFKARQGFTLEQEAIDRLIEAVKAKYPKPVAV